jgi:hypothetical protein
MSSDSNKQAPEVDKSKDRVYRISSKVAIYSFVIMIIGMIIIAFGIPADFPGWILGISIVSALAGLILGIASIAIKDWRSVSLASPEELATLKAQEANNPSFLRQLFRLFFD